MVKSKALMAAVFFAILQGTSHADDLPYGWAHCTEVYAEEGQTACTSYVAENCADAAQKNQCLKEHANDWLSFNVNARLRESAAANDLKAMANAAFLSSALLKKATHCGDDGACLLSHAIKNALKDNAATE